MKAGANQENESAAYGWQHSVEVCLRDSHKEAENSFMVGRSPPGKFGLVWLVSRGMIVIALVFELLISRYSRKPR